MDAHDLELENMSLYKFLQKAQQLLEDEEQADFVRFVLTGRHAGKQAYINAILNSLPEDEELGATRDYDSLLGIDSNIRLTGPLTVYPVSKREDVLFQNIHIHYNFRCSRVSPSYFTSMTWVTAVS